MKTPHRSIVITGFMAAGKTAVATELADRLTGSFIDLDHFIAKREGRNVERIIGEDGEKQFRAIETEALRDILMSEEPDVIALGGGTWTIAQNREMIAQHNSITVWLDAPFDLCWRRISNESGSRPLARGRAEAQDLYLRRRPIYAEATVRVEVVEDKSVEAVSMEILRSLPQTERFWNVKVDTDD